MNKEQLFIVNEFINRHATKNVWNVSDKLLDMAKEIVQAGDIKPVVEVVDEEVGMPAYH
jgi:hypothetical protein